MKKLVLVVGMHRSGTSMVSGVLNDIIGVDMTCKGKQALMSKTNYNKKGHFENKLILGFHEEVLKENRGAWNSPPNPGIVRNMNNDPKWVERFNKKILDFVEKSKELCGWKDPRTILFYPLWVNVLNKNGIDFVTIEVTRNLDSINKSLSRRESETKKVNYTVEMAGKLSNHYLSLIDKERARSRKPWKQIKYESFLENPVSTTSDLCQFLGVEFKEKLGKKSKKFVDKSLNHGIM